MADLGHELTDKRLKELEKRIAAEYQQATAEVRKKLEDYLRKVEAGRKQQEALYKAGKITKQEYSDWCYRHMMVGARWENMRDVLADDFHNANQIALKMAHDEMPDIYALNGNYALYRIEHDAEIDTGLALYNHDTAEYLLGDQRQLMPKPSTKKAREIAANKDMQWNMQKIQSAVLQGVLQGESPYDVAKRLQSVGQMNYNAAVRYARTMTTSAQNAGRYETFRRAERLGVDLTIEWQATLDSRTRHEHRQMHGQRTDVDKPFHTPDGYTIYYPADCTGSSNAPQREIWNCRCTLLSWVKGFEGETVTSSPDMGDMTFEEWQEAKPQSKPHSQEQKQATEKPPKENKQEKTSYIEQLSSNKADFHEVFGYTAESNWGYSEDDPEDVMARSIENTLARLQKDFPMQQTIPREYKANLDRFIACDYERAWMFLPRGEDDPRLDSWGVIAQVFTEYNRDTKIDSAVIAFNRGLISRTETVKDAIAQRERAIKEGRNVISLATMNLETTVTHEWGHVFSEHMTSAMFYQDKDADEYFEWYKTLSKEDIKSGISEYASTNRGEFEAECFLEMQMPNPRPIALEWWNYMEKVIAKGY